MLGSEIRTSDFVAIEWNSIRLGGHANRIVTKTGGPGGDREN